VRRVLSVSATQPKKKECRKEKGDFYFNFKGLYSYKLGNGEETRGRYAMEPWLARLAPKLVNSYTGVKYGKAGSNAIVVGWLRSVVEETAMID